MRAETKKAFIDYFMKSDEHINSISCSEFLKVSPHKAKEEIKELKRELKIYGATIESKCECGNGYILIINDEDKFEYYLKY